MCLQINVYCYVLSYLGFIIQFQKLSLVYFYLSVIVLNSLVPYSLEKIF